MIELFGRRRSRRALQRVLRGSDPPSLPHGAVRLMDLLRDPDTELEAICEALSWDPGLVVRVLRAVNSAAFGLRTKIESVPHAVSILGRSMLEQLVIGVAVKDALPSAPARGFDAGRFWRAAFFRAALARAIAGELHPADEARSFTGGLLQDMAVPLLAHARPEEYGDVLEAWHGSEESELHVLERRSLGWSHDEVGGHLAVDWELPASLASAIQAHHRPDAGADEVPPALRLVAVLRETADEHGLDALIEEGRALFGLDPDWVRGEVRASAQRARELAAAL